MMNFVGKNYFLPVDDVYDCSKHKNESECEAAGGYFVGYNMAPFLLACDWKL